MNTYTPEVKASVVTAWMAGASLNQLVAQFKVPKTTVARWVSDLERIAPAPSPGPKKISLVDLSYELATESFNAAIAILRLAQDRAWLEKQNANDLAILFGVNADKLYRLLPAFTGPASNVDADAAADHAGETQPA